MKKIVPLLLISILALQTMHAQEDSTAYERRPFQFTFLFPPLSTNGAQVAIHIGPTFNVSVADSNPDVGRSSGQYPFLIRQI